MLSNPNRTWNPGAAIVPSVAALTLYLSSMTYKCRVDLRAGTHAEITPDPGWELRVFRRAKS